VQVLQNCDIPARLTLRTHFYYYSFKWPHQDPQWPHPDVTVYRGSATITPNDLRQDLLGKGWTVDAASRRWWDRGTLLNAGWHCSSCFTTVSETVTKRNSSSHQGWNTAENRDLDTLVARVRGGTDFFARIDRRILRVDANADVTSYVVEQNQ
jgi:beta-1,4-mannosyl-glycoprotein beta-1,4-N-acetylglucosaminyltransferase